MSQSFTTYSDVHSTVLSLCHSPLAKLSDVHSTVLCHSPSLAILSDVHYIILCHNPSIPIVMYTLQYTVLCHSLLAKLSDVHSRVLCQSFTSYTQSCTLLILVHSPSLAIYSLMYTIQIVLKIQTFTSNTH